MPPEVDEAQAKRRGRLKLSHGKKKGFSTIPDGCLICLAFIPSTVVLWLNDSCTFLVGGFNISEKYESNWKSSPILGMKIKNS